MGLLGMGLAKFDGTIWKIFNTANSGLPHDLVYSIVLDEHENVWIGTDGGLAVYREGGVIK